MQLVGAAVGALAIALAAWGALLDVIQPLDQLTLFAGLQVASLSGAALGLALRARHVETGRQLALRAGAVWIGWRLAYFPIMVFSGHVASIGEWILAATGLPIVVYPTFLLAVAALHGAAASAIVALVDPPLPWLRLALAPAFLMAALVSFNKPEDLRPLPDTQISLDEPIPPMREAEQNPYLPALVAEGYWPNQRVVLLAAGLTYDTIPPSPWATTVKAVLEGLFEAHPFGSTADRVREHYLAYHSAHPRIGCRRPADCPIAP